MLYTDLCITLLQKIFVAGMVSLGMISSPSTFKRPNNSIGSPPVLRKDPVELDKFKKMRVSEKATSSHRPIDKLLNGFSMVIL